MLCNFSGKQNSKAPRNYCDIPLAKPESIEADGLILYQESYFHVITSLKVPGKEILLLSVVYSG